MIYDFPCLIGDLGFSCDVMLRIDRHAVMKIVRLTPGSSAQSYWDAIPPVPRSPCRSLCSVHILGKSPYSGLLVNQGRVQGAIPLWCPDGRRVCTCDHIRTIAATYAACDKPARKQHTLWRQHPVLRQPNVQVCSKHDDCHTIRYYWQASVTSMRPVLFLLCVDISCI
jgi:hypothetical protein